MGEIFLTDKKLLSMLLGLWLLIYVYKGDISGIKSAALWGVLGIIMYLVLNVTNLLYCSWNEDIIEDKDLSFFTLNANLYDITSSIATILLSFSFHTYCFSIYECLDSPDQKKMIVTSSIGIFVSMLIYLLVGTIGYILYGSKITDSILDSMSFSGLAVLENISFVVNVVMSFPLTFSALKHYFMFLVEILVSIIVKTCIKKKENLVEKTSFSRTQTSSVRNTKIEDLDESINLHQQALKHPTHHKRPDHLHIVHIPNFIEYILIFLLFLSIFYTANTYPNMKIVSFIKIDFNNLYLIFRFLDFLEPLLLIYLASFCLPCTLLNSQNIMFAICKYPINY